MRTLVLLLIMLCVAPLAHAQIELDLPELSELVTNADIEPDADMTLLVIHGGEQDQASLALADMLARPQTQAMAGWIAQLNIKFVDAGSPLAERHSDLLSKHPSLPIVALIEAPGTAAEGAVWWSASPPTLQLREDWIASQLANYYAATIEAKARAGQLPAQPGGELNSMPPGWIGDERPQPYTPRPRRPSLINPQINHNVDVPDAIATNVDAGMRTEQMLTRLAIIVGGAWLLAAFVNAWGRLQSARTMADA